MSFEATGRQETPGELRGCKGSVTAQNRAENNFDPGDLRQVEALRGDDGVEDVLTA
jgi:hypothetical protein